MGEIRKGFILTKKDMEQAGKDVDMHRYSSWIIRGGRGRTFKIYNAGMDKLEPGGGIVEHYHVK